MIKNQLPCGRGNLSYVSDAFYVISKNVQDIQTESEHINNNMREVDAVASAASSGAVETTKPSS